MELRNRDGDLFADVERVNNVYPMVLRVLLPKVGLAAWTHAGKGTDLTHEELVEHLQQVDLVRQKRR